MRKALLFLVLALSVICLASCELFREAPPKGTLHVIAAGYNFQDSEQKKICITDTYCIEVNALSSCENDADAV